MENISNFLNAIKIYGVPEISCFQTVDLYENKQCYKIIECLRALAAVVGLPNWGKGLVKVNLLGSIQVRASPVSKLGG